MVWYAVVWHGLVWYGIVCHGMVLGCPSKKFQFQIRKSPIGVKPEYEQKDQQYEHQHEHKQPSETNKVPCESRKNAWKFKIFRIYARVSILKKFALAGSLKLVEVC